MNLYASSSAGSFRFVSLFLIAAVCLIAYSHTFSVPFQFDDSFNISEKPFVRNIGAFFGPLDPEWISPGSTFIMRPVGFFTFAVNYRIHGDAVEGYHIVNILIHILNGFLVYFLVLLTFRTPYFVLLRSVVDTMQYAETEKTKIKGVKKTALSTQHSILSSQPSAQLAALFTALLFVCHPVQTQAVTYIVQRFTSLATLFYLLSLTMYVKWRLQTGEGTPLPSLSQGVGFTPQPLPPLSLRGGEEGLVEKKRFLSSMKRFLLYAISLITAVLAMKTKEIAFTLPLAIALSEFLFFEGGLKKRILYLVPLLLTMLIIPLSLAGSTKPLGEIIGDASEVTRIQTGISRWEYFFTQLRVIVTYIRLLFFPVNQNLDYDYPVYHKFFDPNVILSFLFLAALFAAAVYLLYRSRLNINANKSPHPALTKGGQGGMTPPKAYALSPMPIAIYFRLIAFGIFWFFITLSVESSVIPISDVIFEHRLYLPSVGFFIAVTAVLSIVWGRLTNISKAWSKRVIGVFGLIVVILSGATYARNNFWRDEVKLWEDVVKKSPSKLRVRSNLGQAYNKHGRFKDAEREYQIALRLDPDDYQLHNNLGVVYKGQGRLKDAIREYQLALRFKPDDAFAYYNLGNIFRELGDFEEAIQHYRIALRLEPGIPIMHNNLGIAFIGQGDKEAAAREFRTALDLDPGYEAARKNLETLLRGGDI